MITFWGRLGTAEDRVIRSYVLSRQSRDPRIPLLPLVRYAQNHLMATSQQIKKKQAEELALPVVSKG